MARTSGGYTATVQNVTINTHTSTGIVKGRLFVCPLRVWILVDRRDPHLVIVLLPDGANVNHTLVKVGWWCRKYALSVTVLEQSAGYP